MKKKGCIDISGTINSTIYKNRFCFSTFLLISAMIIVLVKSATADAETAFSPRIREAMKIMKEDSLKYGEPRISGTGLYFGSTKINGNYDIVDSMMARFGCTATFFVKKDEGFMRISTNVLDKGVRAIGTMLDPKGLAIASLGNNKAFYGIVDILGRKYDTGYEPVRNAEGEIIGIYYIGYCIEN